MSRRGLIINADDFGLTPGVNRGIVRAYREGVVTSTTLMVNMAATAEAVAMAKATPGLAVGLHLTLTAGRPIAPGVDSLTGPDGRFLRGAALLGSATPGDLEREVRAQVAAFQQTGLPLSHIDSHHHLHMESACLWSIVTHVAAELGVPVRGGAGCFTAAFYGRGRISPAALSAILDQLPEGIWELMCHPAEVDGELERLSSYCGERAEELATLTSPEVRQALTERQIELTQYRSAST